MPVFISQLLVYNFSTDDFSNDRYDRHISPQSLYSRDPPNLRSLQSEMQDMQQVGNACCQQVVICGTDILSSVYRDFLLCRQQHHRALEDISLSSLHTHSDDIQSIIHRIKSAEIANLLHNKYPERVRGERGEYDRG